MSRKLQNFTRIFRTKLYEKDFREMIPRGTLKTIGGFAIVVGGIHIARAVPDRVISWRELVLSVLLLLGMMTAIRGIRTLMFAYRNMTHGEQLTSEGDALGVATLRKTDGPPMDLRLKTTARHEAAHAVAVIVLGRELKTVSSKLDLNTRMLGHIAWVHPHEPSLDLVTVSLIGNMAQVKPNDYRLASISDDYQSALRAAVCVAMHTGENPSFVLDEGMRQARKILHDHEHQIEALAAVLAVEPTILTGQQAHEIVANATRTKDNP